MDADKQNRTRSDRSATQKRRLIRQRLFSRLTLTPLIGLPIFLAGLEVTPAAADKPVVLRRNPSPRVLRRSLPSAKPVDMRSVKVLPSDTSNVARYRQGRSIQTFEPISISQPTGLLSGPIQSDQLSVVDIAVPPVLTSGPSEHAVASSSRLRRSAQISFVESKSRLDRGAVYSARQLAHEGLRKMVESRDVLIGGNRFSKQLSSALLAMQEARDFESESGVIGADGIAVRISSHQTHLLKKQNPESWTAFQAREAYLTFAGEELAKTIGTFPESIDVFILLGQIERRLAFEHRKGQVLNPYRMSLALTMHRAAAIVQPNNAFARQELGRMLVQLGMPQEASKQLRRSVAIAPSKVAIQSLAEIAGAAGDWNQANHYRAILASQSLPAQSNVRQMQPEAFSEMSRSSPRARLASHPQKSFATQANQPQATQPQTNHSPSSRDPASSQPEKTPQKGLKRFLPSWLR